MNIALLGSRGIPAFYGGFDTFVEELSLGLASSDVNKVLVYCRSSYFKNKPSSIQGVNLIYLPAPRIKALESLLHSFLSSLHVLGQDIDIIYFVDHANAPFCVLLRLFGKRVIIHTDGLGWKRRKWGRLARKYYKFVEWLSTQAASALVTDNIVMQDYYQKEYNAESFYIPYGSTNRYSVNEAIYEELNLSQGGYLLVVARLEPENNIDFIIKEYNKLNSSIPMLVVGDSPYNPRYMTGLQKIANERVYFAGRINDQSKLNALYKGAYLYIHGHEVGGTNPSLLRAMQAGATPLVINVPFNTTTIDGCGFVFDKLAGSLSNMLEYLLATPAEIHAASKKARIRAESHFTWELVVKEHVQIFNLLVRK